MTIIIVVSVACSMLCLIPETKSEQDIASRLESSLFYEKIGYMYDIKFANKIMTDRVNNKGEQRHNCDIVKW